MVLPSLSEIAKVLRLEDIERLLALKRAGPKLEKLQAKQKKLTAELADVDRQIAALEVGKAATTSGKGGRPAKVATVPATRGRPGRTSVAPAKRGRGRPPKAKSVAKVGRPHGRPAKAGSEAAARHEAMLARMAKMRAVRAANLKAAGKG